MCQLYDWPSLMCLSAFFLCEMFSVSSSKGNMSSLNSSSAHIKAFKSLHVQKHWHHTIYIVNIYVWVLKIIV